MITHVLHHTIPAAYGLLPEPMNMTRATVLLLAIGLQESNFSHRRQQGPGPARGFWQFETGGITAVARHPRTRPPLVIALHALRYSDLVDDVPALHRIVEHNDPLAAVFARLLLWSLPDAIQTTAAGTWSQYLAAWRPGKPRPSTWAEHFHQASILVSEYEHAIHS